MNVPGHTDSFSCKLDRPRAGPILAKDSDGHIQFQFQLLTARVLMPSELSESSIAWSGRIYLTFSFSGRSPQSYRPSARLTKGLTDTWLQLLSSFESNNVKFWKGIHCRENIISVRLWPYIRLALLFKWLHWMQLYHWSGSFHQWCVPGRLRLEYMK